MLTKVIAPGDKLEITRNISEKRRKQLEEENSVFAGALTSQVFEVIDDTQLKIAMPMVRGKMIPLPINSRFNVCFYTKNGLYKSGFVVLKRYRQDGMHVLEVELIYELKKYQRRQYYRLECMIEIAYICVDDEFIEQGYDDEDIKRKFELEHSTEGIVIDISGGGIRFASEEQLQVGSVVLVKLNIRVSEDRSVYGVLGRVLGSRRMPNNEGMYEQRIEYQEISGKSRETIIKYIFEQERKLRKK